MDRLRIALVAHDHRKDDLMAWAVAHRPFLATCRLVATGTTGRLLADALDLPVKRVASGPYGGDQQIGARIVEGRIDALVFFWDPLMPQPHDPDVKALLRVGVLHNIPIASNRATADLLVAGLATVTRVLAPEPEAGPDGDGLPDPHDDADDPR